MTIIQLEYLLAVANHGSFSLAAEHCFVTQPTLSMQIKNLEEELGVTLLDRTKQPVVPTEQGKEVLENARAATMAFNHVREAVSATRGEVSGTLTVGIIPTAAPWLIPKFVPSMREKHPKVKLDVREMLMRDITAAMLRDTLDCAIVSAGSGPDNFAEQELFDDPFHVYISTGNRLFGRTNLRVEDIDPDELVLMTEGHCLRDQVLDIFPARRAPDDCRCNSLETMLRMADGTDRIAIIPEIAAAQLPKEQVAKLARGNLSRKIVLATRRSYVKTALIEALKNEITG